MKRLALALLLMASQADAATKYVSVSGGFTYANANAVGTPTTLALANAGCAAGDSIILAAGAYSTPIQPNANGTSGSRIVYAGDPALPNSVVVAGIYFGGTDSGGSVGNVNWGDFVSVRWVSSTGPLSLQVRQQPSAYTSVKNAVVTKVAAVGTLTLLSNFSILDSLTITGSGTIDMNSQNLGGCLPSYNTLKNSNITLSNAATSSLNFWWVRDCYYNLFQNNTISFASTVSGAGYNIFGELYESQYNRFLSNTFNITNNATNSGTQMICGLRDYASYNQFIGNTWNVNGSKPTVMMPANGGSVNSSVRGNRWDSNIIKLATPIAGYAAFYYENGGRGDTLQFNIIASGNTARAMATNKDGFTVPFDSMIVRHNTFYSGGGTVVDLASASAAIRSRYVSNIAYGTTANGTGTAASVIVPSGMGMDSLGVILNRGGINTSAIRYNGVNGPPGSGILGYGASLKAKWATPRFTDSTYASLNTTLLSASPAQDPNLHDGFAGAIGSATADASRPAPVSPLSVSASSTSSITLTWTAVGNDSLTGTATAYDIRYSSSLITSANFLSAAQATSMPSPAAAGATETFAVTGLAPSTIYHFALRTSDGTTWSALSDTARCATSPTGDTTPPAAITDMAVQVSGATSMFVSWTQVGDDGLVGAVSSYDVRRSTSTITSANFGSATQVGYAEQPDVAGSRASFDDTGLSAATTYYYAGRSTDDAGNISAISNVSSATTPANPDVTAPGQITLAVIASGSTYVTLGWTAVGNDGPLTGGACALYDLRRSSSALVEGGWAGATVITGEPTPGTPGIPETMTVSGLSDGTTYHFAMKADDAAGNHSTISNSVSATPAAATAAKGFRRGARAVASR